MSVAGRSNCRILGLSPAQILAVVLAGLVLLSLACRRSIKQRRYHAKIGIAARIDLDSGGVSMDCYNASTGVKESFSGHVTQATQVMVNGVSARVEDLRVGDPATAVAYWDDEHRKWIVTSVSVQREESYMLEKPLPADVSNANTPVEGR